MHWSLALFYGNRGMHEQSIEAYNKALSLDPNYPDALNLVAYEYMALRNFEKEVGFGERKTKRHRICFAPVFLIYER